MGVGVGGAVGVTGLDGVDGTLVPAALVAVTVNVYDVPLVSPVTVAVRLRGVEVATRSPGLEVTV